jgi:hypothetical protein
MKAKALEVIKIAGTSRAFIPRMNKPCWFVLQYNAEALVLVLQYYSGK